MAAALLIVAMPDDVLAQAPASQGPSAPTPEGAQESQQKEIVDKYKGRFDLSGEIGLFSSTTELAGVEAQYNFSSATALSLSLGLGEASYTMAFKGRSAGRIWSFAFVPQLTYQPGRDELFVGNRDSFRHVVYAGLAGQVEARGQHAFVRMTFGGNLVAYSEDVEGEGDGPFPFLPILSLGAGISL